MIISPFTPLFFSPSTDKYGAKSKYVQKFASTDHIFVEIIANYGEKVPNMFIHNLITEEDIPIVFSSWKMNKEETIYFYVISKLPPSYYKISINDSTSEIFKITDDSNELAETTLIQYSMEDNRQRFDSIFWIDGMQYFMDFRVPGGFKDAGWTFGVDNEQFVTADEDVVELYSHEYTMQTFTLGNAMGCPVWFAELFNRILCCTYVYFDGVRYARKESNVPELNQQVEGLKSFIFNQIVQKVKTMNPALEWNNQVSMRRIYGDTYRIVEEGDDLRSIKQGTEDEKYDIADPLTSIYVNLEEYEYVPEGVSIIDYSILELTKIDKSSEDDYLILCRIPVNAISERFIDRNTGEGMLYIEGLDNLASALGLGRFTLELRVDLIKGTHPSNGIVKPLIDSAGNAASTIGSIELFPLTQKDITASKSLVIYLKKVPTVAVANVEDNPLKLELAYTE